MGYSVEAINSEESSVKKRKALQEQILNMNRLHAGRTQRDGTKVEDPDAVTRIESKTDSVEISAQGQKAMKQKANSDEEKAQGSDHSAPDVSGKKDTGSTNLRSRSRSELSTLVAEGIITRTDMKNELKRRSALSFPPQTPDQV